MERFERKTGIPKTGNIILNTMIIPKCAICGENLIFVLNKVERTLEIFPCVCQEMELQKLENYWLLTIA